MSRDVAHKLIGQIRPLLADQTPEVMGQTLQALAALWLASIEPAKRDDIWRQWIASVDEMVADVIKANVKAGRLPPEWLREQ